MRHPYDFDGKLLKAGCQYRLNSIVKLNFMLDKTMIEAYLGLHESPVNCGSRQNPWDARRGKQPSLMRSDG